MRKKYLVNNRPAYNAGRLGNALIGHFSRGTTVPVFTVFMDPTQNARVFMKTIKVKNQEELQKKRAELLAQKGVYHSHRN